MILAQKVPKRQREYRFELHNINNPVYYTRTESLSGNGNQTWSIQSSSV